MDRIRKLLELSHSTNEHEAAAAGSRAAELMSDNAITEAMIEVFKGADEPAPHITERIVEYDLNDEFKTKHRVAWRDRIVSALATSLDCERFYTEGNLVAFGRESNVKTWQYVSAYLIREVDRLADEAWLREGADLAAVGQMPRPWKSAYPLGAADVIHERLYAEHYKRKEREKQLAGAKAKELSVGAGETPDAPLALVRVSTALEAVAKDRKEVVDEFKARTKGFRSVSRLGNSTRGRSGYGAGREAGARVNLKGGGNLLK